MSILTRPGAGPAHQRSGVGVHLAAAVGVKLIVENPVHTVETNIMGTEMVLEAST